MRRAAAVLFGLVSPALVVAQSGSIPVVVDVALGSHGVPGLELTITPLGGGASILTRTDSSGKAAVRLSPGRYRIRSLTPTQRDGAEYSWDVEATIRGLDKSVAVTLTRQNAAVTGSSILSPGTTVINPTPSQPSIALIARYPTSLGPTDRGYRDPNMALLFGLLLSGGGHFYSGEITTGVALLLAPVGLLGVALSTCDYNSCEETVTAAALTSALVLVIYGWVDAPAAAKRANRAGARQIGLGPIHLRPHANGLAFSIPLP